MVIELLAGKTDEVLSCNDLFRVWGQGYTVSLKECKVFFYLLCSQFIYFLQD